MNQIQRKYYAEYAADLAMGAHENGHPHTVYY
jgi:hypothetical protein